MVTSTDPKHLFDEYLRSLSTLLSNQIDAVRYEDKCRGILGTSSYLMFTMDKQISKLVKQVGWTRGDFCLGLGRICQLSLRAGSERFLC